MKKCKKFYFLICVLAFCSIVYELILAQALSAFLENTVLRYSVTIGLYMFSMGIGSLLAEGKMTKNPILNLLRVEILLTVFGGLSVLLLFSIDTFNASRFIFSFFAHTLIIVIGVLTGFEVPLVIEIVNRENKNLENAILAWDYLGAFIGTIIFAFIFYPHWGLIPTSLFIGILNAMGGISLVFSRQHVSAQKMKSFQASLRIQIFLFFFIFLFCVFSNQISNYFIDIYIH